MSKDHTSNPPASGPGDVTSALLSMFVFLFLFFSSFIFILLHHITYLQCSQEVDTFVRKKNRFSFKMSPIHQPVVASIILVAYYSKGHDK